MSLKFEDRVAIVTGAGNGLGRAYSLELARRGACVVVNDFGGTHVGQGSGSEAADSVVNEIQESGGKAVASYDSVTDKAGVDNLIRLAMKSFGHIDILVANAGIHRPGNFIDMSDENFRDVLEVHLMGSVNCIRAVWSQMCDRGYGRIVVTTSDASLFGIPDDANYVTAKMGLVGLMNALKLEGQSFGIRINAIAPMAATRMSRDLVPDDSWNDFREAFKPEYVTPALIYLSSEDATDGAIISAGAGHYSTLRVMETPGVNLGPKATAEDVAEHASQIYDFSNAVSFDNMGERLAHLYSKLADTGDPAQDEFLSGLGKSSWH